jgi:magnesium-transporting ATPase (P-type)
MGEEKKELVDKLLEILGHCESVIVCRASPSQKA